MSHTWQITEGVDCLCWRQSVDISHYHHAVLQTVGSTGGVLENYPVNVVSLLNQQYIQNCCITPLNVVCIVG
jgi:hypothetical protein